MSNKYKPRSCFLTKKSNAFIWAQLTLDDLAPDVVGLAGRFAELCSLEVLRLRLRRGVGDSGLQELRKKLQGCPGKLRGLHLLGCQLSGASVAGLILQQ